MSLYEIDNAVTQRRLAAITGSGLRALRERTQRSTEIDKHVRDMRERHERERQAIDEQLTTLELPSAGILDIEELRDAARHDQPTDPSTAGGEPADPPDSTDPDVAGTDSADANADADTDIDVPDGAGGETGVDGADIDSAVDDPAAPDQDIIDLDDELDPDLSAPSEDESPPSGGGPRKARRRRARRGRGE